MRFSFIGLGNMGAPLAKNILQTQGNLAIWSSREQTARKFAELGARVVEKPQDLAACDVLCTCVPKPQDLKKLLTGADGLYERMSPGALHLDFTTIDPQTASELEAKAGDRGLDYVQATVSKTPQVAAKREAPFFVGGAPAAVDRIFSVLEKIGKPVRVGGVEASCAIKILSNQIGMSIIALVAEGLKIGSLAHLDLDRLLDLLMTTGAASFQMGTRGPWIAAGDFTARFSVDLALKDLGLGKEMARSMGYEPRMIGQTIKYLEEARDAGLGDEDVCAIYKILRTQEK